jgi:tRNA(fMet)-specific endonuclease VapC
MYAGSVAMWILDTDHVSAVIWNNQKVIDRLDQVRSNATTTIITVQEVFNGWAGELNQPKRDQDRGRTEREITLAKYLKFHQSVQFFRTLPILEFDDRAYDLCVQLLSQNSALRKKDLQQDVRIAAIALTHNAIVVTRNRKDFGLVPGLQIEDWSV